MQAFRSFFAGSHNPYVMITTLDQTAHVTVTNNFRKRTTNYVINARSVREIELPVSLQNTVNGITDKSLHITSTVDVIVEGYHVNEVSADGYLALPATSYGKQYIIATYTPNLQSQFLITASQDQTKISIIFPRNVVYNGVTYSKNKHLIFTMQRSQSFYYGYNQDLTGTVINTNKNVAVYAGNRCAYVPVGSSECEVLIEQFLPTRTLGTNYVLTTFADRIAGDIYRVVAAYDNTNVQMHLNGQTKSLSQGSYTEFQLGSNSGMFVNCSKPCAVAHYSKGHVSNDDHAEPMMIVIPAFSQYQSSYTFYSVITPGNDVTDRFINIAILDSQKSGLRIDGNTLEHFHHVEWHQVTTSHGTFAVSAISIHEGRHVINHINPNVHFSLTQYGYGHSLSYGFLAGIKLSFNPNG